MTREAVILKPYKIESHPNVNRLSIITFGGPGGWTCVTGLNQFDMNSLILYIEPDSVVPDSIVEHLQKTCKIKVSNRIKSIKLRGSISEGLCLNPEDFLSPGDITEGKDVSEKLGITHYEPPAPRYSQANNITKGKNLIYHNEFFKKYTHIDRFQKHPTVLTKNDMVCVTRKMHGMNARFGIVKKPLKVRTSLWYRFKQQYLNWLLPVKSNDYLVGSHNTIRVPGKWDVDRQKDHFWRASDKYKLEEAVKHMQSVLKKITHSDTPDVIIFAEVIGWQTADKPVQNNYEYGYKKGEVGIRVFDIMCEGKYLNWHLVKSLCYKTRLPVVKELYNGPFNLDLLKLAEAVDTYGEKEYVREGVVIKPLVERKDHRVGRVILKEINKEYSILKQSEHH